MRCQDTAPCTTAEGSTLEVQRSTKGHYTDNALPAPSSANATEISANKARKAVRTKSSSEYINNGSCFEDLNETSATMKTDSYLDTRIKSYFYFHNRI